MSCLLIFCPFYLIHPATLLKAVPLSAQHLMESMLFLARALSLDGGQLLLPVLPFGIPYSLMSAIPSLGLSFALNCRLTSSALPMDFNDFPASICTSELCKEGYIISQLYCIIMLYCI